MKIYVHQNKLENHVKIFARKNAINVIKMEVAILANHSFMMKTVIKHVLIVLMKVAQMMENVLIQNIVGIINILENIVNTNVKKLMKVV